MNLVDADAQLGQGRTRDQPVAHDDVAINAAVGRLVDLHGEWAELDAQGLGQIRVPLDEGFMYKGSKVVVALRPEKLMLSENRNTEIQNTVQGKLSTSAYLGDRTHFFVTIDGCEEAIEIASQESGLSSDQSLERGGKVWISWAENSLIVLPAS